MLGHKWGLCISAWITFKCTLVQQLRASSRNKTGSNTDAAARQCPRNAHGQLETKRQCKRHPLPQDLCTVNLSIPVPDSNRKYISQTAKRRLTGFAQTKIPLLPSVGALTPCIAIRKSLCGLRKVQLHPPICPPRPTRPGPARPTHTLARRPVHHPPHFAPPRSTGPLPAHLPAPPRLAQLGPALPACPALPSYQF